MARTSSKGSKVSLSYLFNDIDQVRRARPTMILVIVIVGILIIITTIIIVVVIIMISITIIVSLW